MTGRGYADAAARHGCYRRMGDDELTAAKGAALSTLRSVEGLLDSLPERAASADLRALSSCPERYGATSLELRDALAALSDAARAVADLAALSVESARRNQSRTNELTTTRETPTPVGGDLATSATAATMRGAGPGVRWQETPERERAGGRFHSMSNKIEWCDVDITDTLYCPITMANPEGPYSCFETDGDGKCRLCPCESLKKIDNSMRVATYVLQHMDGANVDFLDMMRTCFDLHVPEEPITD